MYYAKSTGGFLADDLKDDYLDADSWPDDAIEVSAADYAALMLAQRNGHRIQPNADGYPVAVPPSLAEQQSATWGAIKDKRAAICSGGVEVAVSAGVSKWFQTDDTSRLQYLGLKDTARDMLAGGHAMSDALQLGGQAIEWKTFDNSFVALTLQNAFDIVAAVKALDAQAFANAETHRANMLNAADPTTYDFSTGWPAVYGA